METQQSRMPATNSLLRTIFLFSCSIIIIFALFQAATSGLMAQPSSATCDEGTTMEQGYFDLRWSTNGQQLAVAIYCIDNEGYFSAHRVEIRNALTNEIAFQLDSDYPHPPTAVAWKSDSSELAIGFRDGMIRRWNVLQQILIAEYQVYTMPVNDLVYSSDGLYLAASAAYDSNVRVLELSTGNQIALNTNQGNTSLSWMSTTSGLVVGGSDGFLRVFTGSQLTNQFDIEINPSGTETSTILIEENPDGSRIAVISGREGKYDNAFSVLDMSTGQAQVIIGGHNGGTIGVAWNQTGSQLVSIGNDGQVKIWDSYRGNLLYQAAVATQDGQSVSFIDWSVLGQIAIGVSEETISELTVEPLPPILIPVSNLLLSPFATPLCTSDPATMRNWRITNPNAAELAVTWQLFNSPTQMGTVTIPANGTYDFSTTVEAGNETMRLIVGGQVVAEATGSAEPCGGGVVTPTPTSTPSPEATPTPTVTESLTETPTATGTLEATATPTETPTSTPSPEATLTPTATGTPPTGSTFYRAVNLGGPALTIGGNAWEANETTTVDFSTNGFVLCNPWLTFNPAASGAQAEMLSCWREHWAHDMAMSNMPSGTYEVYVYVVQSWNDPAGVDPFTLRLEGADVDSYAPGVVDGVWVRRGPFTVSVTDGALNLTTQDGNPVLTGLEVYSVGG
jgi:WD40 repeat protein